MKNLSESTEKPEELFELIQSPKDCPITVLSILLPPVISKIILDYIFKQPDSLKENGTKFSVVETLNDSDFSYTNWRKVKISDCDLYGTVFSHSLMHETYWEENRLKDINLSNCIFFKAFFYKTHICGVKYDKQFPVNFEGATFESMNFSYAILFSSNFSQMEITEVKFTNCYFNNCNFEGTIFFKTEFKNCDLSGAKFLNTELLLTQFINTKLGNTALAAYSEFFLKQLSLSSSCYILLINLLQNYKKTRPLIIDLNILNKSHKSFIKEFLSAEENEKKICQKRKVMLDQVVGYQRLYPKVRKLLDNKPDHDLEKCLEFVRLFSNHRRWYQNNEISSHNQTELKLER